MAGEKNILTKENVLLLEPTSGTTTHNKYIPYTKGLKQEYNRAINPWLAGMYITWPTLFKTHQYWSISPVLQHKAHPDTKVPLGFDEDGQYLGNRRSKILNHIMVVPAWVRNLPNSESWAYVTTFFLVRDKYLGIISVWHPSFLRILLEKLKNDFSGLVSDIENGTISGLDKLKDFSNFSVKPLRKRALELRELDTEAQDFFGKVWPSLKLISCWADHHDDSNLETLKRLIPGAYFQPKGLIATEGIVSFPFGKIEGLPAYRSHCVEFINKNGSALKSIDDLKQDEDYEPIISTGGGLYRYRMNDIVRVTGFYKNKLPLLKFLHKKDYVADVRGEKVSLVHVCEIVGILQNIYEKIDYCMIGPVTTDNNAFYCCYIFSHDFRPIDIDKVAAIIDNNLMNNYQYRYARHLGQLSKPRVFILDNDPVDDMTTYIESIGTKRGDIKHYSLTRYTFWPQILKGGIAQ